MGTKRSEIKIQYWYRLLTRQLICGCFLLISFTCISQVKVSGVVKDVNDHPLAAVTVQVKSTQQFTVTDDDGRFTLRASPGQTLIFSYTGFNNKEITVKANENLSVILETKTSSLDEVVVVGYGSQRKSDLTGAVASLNTKILDERPSPNLVNVLQGSIPGLNISITGSDADGSSSVTRIRGTRSITADARPLIILDGVPFGGSWSEINPNDIQSLDILKDASASAIYGARGANGVILITTKKGRDGKLNLSYEGYVSFDNTVNIPKMMDGETFWKYKVEALKMANTTPPTPTNPEPWMGAITPTEQRMHDEGKSTDWIKVATQNGLKQQHNLSFSGGSKSTKYFVSYNHLDVKGVALNDKFRRDNFRINLSQSLTPWLKISTNTQIGRYIRDGWPPEFGRAFMMVPLAEPYDSNGNIRLSAWEDGSVAYAKNPLSAINEKNSDVTMNIISNNVLDLNIPFIPGLSYKLNTGYTYRANDYKNYQGRNTYEGAQANGILNTSSNISNDWLVENIISYQRNFNKHHLFFTGLYSAQGYTQENNAVTGRDFPNDVMYYYQISKAGTLAGTASYTKTTHESQMARINYSYDNRYLLTATTRRDGYSAFGDNSKFGIFPSLALGWNISNEQFFQHSQLSQIISNLKYRVSYGKNGNEAVNAYVTLPSLSTFNYLTDDHKALYGFYPSRLASPNLGWETTESFNMGLDFALMDNRLNGTFDIYWSNTYDLLLSRSIPTINGTSSIIENVGKTKNNGFEFQINYNVIHTKNFNWSATLNYNHYNTRIVDVGIYDENGKAIDDLGSRWFIGQPINVNFDYVFDGIWQIKDPNNPNGQQDPTDQYSIPGHVKYKDVDHSGTITTADRQIIGRRIPDFTSGLLNSFSYRDFTLSVFLYGVKGITARNVLLNENRVSYRQNQLDKVFWTPENPINTYPKNDLNGAVNPLASGYYRKTDYLRVQDVTLSYQLAERFLSKMKMQRVNLYISTHNLLTFTSWQGLDPEFIDNQLAIPQTRSFVIGLKFSL